MQKNNLENTNPFKHKHNISNIIAQIQKIQNQNSNPNQDIDTNIDRISTSFKIFSISSIFLLTKHKITKKKRSIDKPVCLRRRKKERKKEKKEVAAKKQRKKKELCWSEEGRKKKGGKKKERKKNH